MTEHGQPLVRPEIEMAEPELLVAHGEQRIDGVRFLAGTFMSKAQERCITPSSGCQANQSL